MKRDFTGLTGNDILRAVRKKHIFRLILCVLGVIAGIALLIAVGILMPAHGAFYFIMGVLLAAGLIGCSGFFFSQSFKTLRNVREIPLFRKHGSPDSIAMQLAEYGSQPFLESRQILITEHFIMKYGDFETFMTYEDVLLLYRKEHRTNGVLDGIFLVLYDGWGDSFEYPFKLGKKHADDMEQAAQMIASHAPRCRFGYTNDNLNYVKQNKKQRL